MVKVTLNGTQHTGRTLDTVVRREHGRTAQVKVGNAVGAGKAVTVTRAGKVVSRGVAYGV